ncbi:Acg family FMN-binding oxidoreductase [Streptomyces sp. NPDC058256]|uniref:Acg family FMN-binding oxidoreductase n=1 Tax=Streptomyces sp. NPDC058256 TaxID=3346408 RepID=UPI0036E65B3F
MSVEPLDPKTVEALVLDAGAAPSMHNAQPWTFRFRFHSGGGTFELRSDPERAIPHSDPDNRALHIGCGAALFNLRVASVHVGREPVTALLPDRADPDLLATVRLEAPLGAGRDLASLYPAISRRHTSRHPFTDQDIPKDLRADLCEAARGEGAQLTFPAPWHVQELLDLVGDAEGRDARDPGTLEDLKRWTRTGTDTAADGVPEYAFGPRKKRGRAPVRDFAGREAVAGRGAATFEDAPCLALLGTVHDSPADWLRAGQALERVLLVATLRGLATALTSQALERSDLRWIARDPTTATGFVQMVLRLGYGPVGLATPRRAAREVLDLE